MMSRSALPADTAIAAARKQANPDAPEHTESDAGSSAVPAAVSPPASAKHERRARNGENCRDSATTPT